MIVAPSLVIYPQELSLRNRADEDATAGRAREQLIAAYRQPRHEGIQQARIDLLPTLSFVLGDEHAVDAPRIDFPPARREGKYVQVRGQTIVDRRPILPAVTRDADAAARCSCIKRAAASLPAPSLIGWSSRD